MSTVLDQQVSLADLHGKPTCREPPLPDDCQDSKIAFKIKIKVRADNGFTWRITCNFNLEKRDIDCKMSHRFSSILCFELICYSKQKERPSLENSRPR